MEAFLHKAKATQAKNGEWEALSTLHKVHCLSFACDADFLLFGTEQGGVEIWDVTALPLRSQAYTVPGAAGSAVVAVAWSHNNQVLFAASANGVLSALDVRSGSVVLSHRCVLVVVCMPPSFTFTAHRLPGWKLCPVQSSPIHLTFLLWP